MGTLLDGNRRHKPAAGATLGHSSSSSPRTGCNFSWPSLHDPVRAAGKKKKRKNDPLNKDLMIRRNNKKATISFLYFLAQIAHTTYLKKIKNTRM
jgi:hypothetical protein